jgi:1-phosphofructokinase
MVYTVTFNPALDYTMWLEHLSPGRVQKSVRESIVAGGKGINVSTILTQLGIQNTALGFIAGFSGDEIERLVNGQGIKHEFIHLQNGNSRINVKIRTANGEETDINSSGCDIDKASLNQFYLKLDNISAGDYLILSGSVPNSLAPEIYETILGRYRTKGVHFVVDATGNLLRGTLKHAPFLIKPNKDEICELFGIPTESIKTDDDLIRLAKSLQDDGARNVLISMGADGAMLLSETGEIIKTPGMRKATAYNIAAHETEQYTIPESSEASEITDNNIAVNTVGAGDSMVAGFIAGWLLYGDYRKALALGAAAGTATAFSEGLAIKNDILKQFKTMAAFLL